MLTFSSLSTSAPPRTCCSCARAQTGLTHRQINSDSTSITHLNLRNQAYPTQEPRPRLELMRLLHTETLQLHTIFDPSHYAILSHRWRDEEIIFKDFDDEGNLLPRARNKQGFPKLELCCKKAHEDDYEYVWIDTCCIDKSSSAELSESLNSMYLWYMQSAICYVFLDDVPRGELPQNENSSFRRSKWFTRGWTLQELIAPSSVIFFNKEWQQIGTKSSLVAAIHAITNVEREVLLFQELWNVSVAKKMSWASKRETTKVEDRAYSLMGLFGVNMPTIYGEGHNAFVRLQQEILKSSNDQTIFAWKIPSCPSTLESGLLASSPDQFEFSSNITCSHVGLFLQRFTNPPIRGMKHDFALTNHGVHLELPVKLVNRDTSTYIAFLACYDDRPGVAGHLLGIYIQRVQNGQYVRTRISELAMEESVSGAAVVNMYIKGEPVSLEHRPVNSTLRGPMGRETAFLVACSSDIAYLPYVAPEMSSEALWKETPEGHRTLVLSPGWTIENLYATLSFEVLPTRQRFWATFGVHRLGVWSNIEDDVAAGFDSSIAADIYESYDFESGSKAWVRSQHSDWIRKPLEDGRNLIMAIRRGKVSPSKREIVIKIFLKDMSEDVEEMTEDSETH